MVLFSIDWNGEGRLCSTASNIRLLSCTISLALQLSHATYTNVLVVSPVVAHPILKEYLEVVQVERYIQKINAKFIAAYDLE